MGSTESDIMKGLISNESPLGKALVGSKLGQEIEVESAEGVSRIQSS